jgi:hypothetical protein
MPLLRNCLAAALFLAAVGTARAQDTRDADLRCLAVMMKFNQLPDTKSQNESYIGGHYYLGRLQAGTPDPQLPQSTADAYNKMSPAEFLSETQRCEKQMRDLGPLLVEISRAMPKAQPEGK